jgi:hypothetical protein
MQRLFGELPQKKEEGGKKKNPIFFSLSSYKSGLVIVESTHLRVTQLLSAEDYADSSSLLCV